MRLIGILITLAVLGYVISVYLEGSDNMPEEMQSRPAEYIDQAKESVGAINDVLKKQQEQLEDNK